MTGKCGTEAGDEFWLCDTLLGNLEPLGGDSNTYITVSLMS